MAYLVTPINLGTPSVPLYKCAQWPFGIAAQNPGFTEGLADGYATTSGYSGSADLIHNWTVAGQDNTPDEGQSATGHVRFGVSCGNSITFQITGWVRAIDSLDTLEIKLNGTVVYTFESSQDDGAAYFYETEGRVPAPVLPGDPTYTQDIDDFYSYYIGGATIPAISVYVPLTERPCGNIFDITATAGPARFTIALHDGERDTGTAFVVSVASTT
jgi:hypothetical protein